MAELLATYDNPRARVADLLCDRHEASNTACRLVSADLTERTVSFADLRQASEQFAAALSRIGVGRGDRVATLLGKTEQHLVSVMAIWRLGAVHVPLFTAFAPPAVAMRIYGSRAKAVICDEAQRPKLSHRDGASAGDFQVIVSGRRSQADDLSYSEMLASEEPGIAAVAVGGKGPLVQLYTSGTTGQPKAVVVPVRALASFHVYMEFGLDLRPDDVFWNAADPGWAYGHYYGILGPLCLGVPNLWLDAGFSPELTWSVLERFRVTNFAAAPTVYRSLRASGHRVPAGLGIRCASAAGEPLTPEVNAWATQALGTSVHDHYGQTEAGMLVNNHHHPSIRRALRPGSMGQPMPGWAVTILREHDTEMATPDQLGRIAVDRTASTLAWFDGYLGDPERSSEKLSADGRWYLTGDAGTVDTDGYLRFISRDDDVIIMAGYRIGPSDVESVLLVHPAVAEAAVVGAPDELRGEVLEAFVVLREGHTASSELADELKNAVKTNYAAHAYPRVVHFVAELPKTPSGKLQRYVLRELRRNERGTAGAGRPGMPGAS